LQVLYPNGRASRTSLGPEREVHRHDGLLGGVVMRRWCCISGLSAMASSLGCDRHSGELGVPWRSPHSPTPIAPTRALTINAPPEQVWPWIVQIGIGRAGFYSYDWLDNLGRPSANEILSEWQHPQVGDLAAPMSPFTKSPTDATAFRVAGLEVNRWLLWEQRLSTWVWVLEPVGESRTRLVTRIRARYDWSGPLAIVWLLLMELGDFPMMRKQLVGIKERAETLASKAPLSRATAPA
jgi:hypothetical protein